MLSLQTIFLKASETPPQLCSEDKVTEETLETSWKQIQINRLSAGAKIVCGSHPSSQETLKSLRWNIDQCSGIEWFRWNSDRCYRNWLLNLGAVFELLLCARPSGDWGGEWTGKQREPGRKLWFLTNFRFELKNIMCFWTKLGFKLRTLNYKNTFSYLKKIHTMKFRVCRGSL